MLDHHTSSPESCIQARSVFDHSGYLAKHLEGAGRLCNTLCFREEYLIFHPGSSGSDSAEELDCVLFDAYSAPRTEADLG